MLHFLSILLITGLKIILLIIIINYLLILVVFDGTNAEISDGPALTDEDFSNADKLTKTDIYKTSIPIEAVNGYKSDIRGPERDRKRFRRNGVSRPTKLWPHARIPYAISPHYTTHERALLARAVKQVLSFRLMHHLFIF